ncbi:hypothetical protein BGZ70_005793 [Mortierella alpina]|uniref:DUF4704 domain-containing protein n=1 Tax=Mortierella alpina TaxID=64518 RepID=A0A9P6J8Z7_MORAP|nr:hypothetical protein BGZ70_005793 [Mortierella alpina]
MVRLVSATLLERLTGTIGSNPVFTGRDVQATALKLSSFLDTFDEAYNEMKIQAEQEHTDMSMERLYGDCSEIMITLFNAIEREASLKKSEKAKCMQEPLDRSLVLINLILKEEKYRRLVADAPDFISRLLSLLEKPGLPGSKVLFLRIIATIGESDRNKIEIAKREGYKKILRLLIADSPELTQEVVRTVNHLLEFNEDHSDMTDLALVAPGLKTSISTPQIPTEPKAGGIISFSPKTLLSRSSVQLSRSQSQHSSLPPRPKSFVMDRQPPRGTSPFDTPRRQNNIGRSLTGIDRVSQAISEVRGIFVQELGKIFPQLKDQDGLGILGMGTDEAGRLSTEKHYIPNAEQIQFTIAYYSQLVGQDSGSTDAISSAEAADSSEPPELPKRPDSAQRPEQSDLIPPSESQSLQPEAQTCKLAKRNSLKKMVSTPNFRVAKRPSLEARRNSEDRIASALSLATRGAAVELAQEEELLRKSQPDNVLKEFMRTQGALRSLMGILSDQTSISSKRSSKPPLSAGTRLATKIDIMETVCKVLFQNSENQLEFRAMDGYTTLLKVFDEIVVPNSGTKPMEHDPYHAAQDSLSADSATGDDSQEGWPGETNSQAGMEHMCRDHQSSVSKRSLLLGSLMAVFFDLALDGSARDMVQNTDAYHFLFRLLLESKQLDVRQQALYAVQDLISLNGLNAVAAWRCGEIDMVIGVLRGCLEFRCDSKSLQDTQWEMARHIGLDPLSADVRNVVFTGQTYFDDFVESEDTAVLAEMIERGSPVYQYVVGLTRLLEYMAVMLTQDNVYILYELSRLLMEIDLPEDSSIIINIVLRSVGRIVADMVARGVPIEEKFASIYLQIVRRMLENRRASRPLSGTPTREYDQEQERELRDCVHTEQRLMALHILGMILKGMGNSVDIFELLQGFDTLASTILLERRSCHHPAQQQPEEQAASYAASLAYPGLCQDCFRSDIVVSDLALWLFRELALQDSGNASIITWIITMLKSTLSGIEELRRQSDTAKGTSIYGHGLLHVQQDVQQDQAHSLLAYLYTKICGTVSLVFRKSSDSKLAFGEACGMQILLSVLSSTQHTDIATAALVAIGDFFAGYEGTKTLLGDSFGYDGFLEIVLDSCRPLDKVCCEIVLEVATVGNVMSTKSRPHVESDSSIYCTEVWPFIADLLDPQPLYHSVLPFTSPRKVGNRNSFRAGYSTSSLSKLDKHGGSPAYQTNGRGTPSRPSSVYLEEAMDLAGSSVLGAQGGLGSSLSTPSSSAASGNAGVTSGGSNRYSIFNMSPWSNSVTPSISISSAQEQLESSPMPLPQLVMDPFEPAGPDSSRRSSLHLHGSGRSTPAPSGVDTPLGEDGGTSNRPFEEQKLKGGITNRKRSNSRNLGGFGLNTTHLGFHSVVPSERIAFKQLAGIVFRDADAARMTLRLLGKIIECNNPKLATDYFNLLMSHRATKSYSPATMAYDSCCKFCSGEADSRMDLALTRQDILIYQDRLTSEPSKTMPALASAIKDSLGPLPELPTKFDRDASPRRNSTGRPRSESASALTAYSGRKAGGRYSGNNSGAFAGIQFNPLFIGEMEQQMMYAIEKISERVDPPAYFNFNGLNASLTTHPGTVDKVVSAKGGYTVSVWVKVTAFLEKETGLFCYEEENGSRTIFELYFKSLDQSNRYCLCVRTQHYPSPPEDFVFDRFDFAETGIWHHIVFVHHKTMKLMVDGCVIQSYGTFNQRRQEKEGTLVGVLGRKGRSSISGPTAHSPSMKEVSILSSSTLPNDIQKQHAYAMSSTSLSSSFQQLSQLAMQETSLGYFCGQTGKVHFLQGEWDQVTAEKVYNLGPASTDSWKTHDIKSAVICVLDPEGFTGDMDKEQDTSYGSSANSSNKRLTQGMLQGGLTIHMTQAMRNLIGQIGGIQLCFRFLEMNPSHLQLVGLRVISNLLYKSPENIVQFQNELNGYEIMYDLLLNTASELSVDHFGVLFDIAINGMIKDEHLILSNMPCVQLILRLLPHTIDSVQSYILRTLVDLIVESPENMRLWRGSFGMTTLFELFRTLPAHLRPFLMWTLESMMDGMTVQELGLLIGFIGHEEIELFEVRRDIIEMLFKRMTTDHGLVDLLGSGLEGVTVLIGLLDSPNEHFRILILKMIGILLSDNTKSGKAALDKPNIGIGLIRSTLEKYPLSMDVIQVLLGLAQNCYRCDANARLFEKGGVVAMSRKSADRMTSAPHQRSPLAMTPPPLPMRELPQLATTPEQHGSSFTVGSLDSNAPESRSATAEAKDTILQGSATPRKHVHSSNANAPYIKMNPVPVEPTFVGSGNLPTTGNAAAAASSTSLSSTGTAKFTDELTYASMIRLILELTGSLPHTDLVTHTLTDLKRLMTSENMRILWEAGWVNWVGAFMLDKAKVRVTSAAENLSYNRAMGVLDGMMQKMMIFDLSRKGSITARNKGSLVSRDEDVGVQLRLTEAALAWFDKNPNLDTDAANVICKGLVILFRRLEELSRKFEEKQRRAEKARLEALERERALQAQLRAQEQEQERLAMEAVSTALSGVLDSFGDSGHSDEYDTKSVLLRADEGDTDAEELSVDQRTTGEESLASEGLTAPLSGSISPTGSSASTLSLPLSTFSANAVLTRDASDSPGASRTPPGSNPTHVQHQQPHQHQLHQRQQPGRRHQRQLHQSRYSASFSNSSTPPALPDPTASMHMPSQDLTVSGSGGIFWPPLALYEHFANCINNLACYNNSAIRAAMKSSGLFKIRDSLLEKLGKMGNDPASGTGMANGGQYLGVPSHHHQHHQQHQHHHHHQQQQHHQLQHPSSFSGHDTHSQQNNTGSIHHSDNLHDTNYNSSGNINPSAGNTLYGNSSSHHVATPNSSATQGSTHPSDSNSTGSRARPRASQRQISAELGLGFQTHY